jgi:hypothetical protein
LPTAAVSERTDIQWIRRDRRVIDGLDHLGIQIVSVNLYQSMLPGITNVTERARYFAFHPWVLHRFAQNGPTSRGKVAWRNWMRRIEYAYAMASTAFDLQRKGPGGAVVGADRATDDLQGKSEEEMIDIRHRADLDADGDVPAEAYFKNPEGGFGQYYKGPLLQLHVLHAHEEKAYPDVQLTNFAGARLAQEIENAAGFQDLLAVAQEGSARRSELAKLGAQVHPDSIPAESSEADLLRSLFFGTDPEMRKGEPPQSVEWRRRTLLLLLSFLRDAGAVPAADPAGDFRWACHTGYLNDGKEWQVGPDLLPAFHGWSTYQRNELLNYALESLLYAVLNLLEGDALRPVNVARALADRAMASVPPARSHPTELDPLPSTVAAFVAAMQHDAAGDARSPESTFGLWSRLRDAVRRRDFDAMPGLAVRLLGRIVTDRGPSVDPFGVVPNGAELVESHEVQLLAWWNRVEKRRDDDLRDFVAELVLDWIIYRHLRVATRKLASQGDSTFKFRPEKGSLVLIAAKLPAPTFTSPRLDQALRILKDLHCVAQADGQLSVATTGTQILGRHNA